MKTEGSPIISQNGSSCKLFLSEASELGGRGSGRASTCHMDPKDEALQNQSDQWYLQFGSEKLQWVAVTVETAN